MRQTFQSEQWLPYPVELVFAFFANPENLPRLMPKWQKARIEEASFAPPPPRPASPYQPQRGIAAGPGTRLTLSFRPFPYSPIRVPWEAEITEFVWNSHFADHQLQGPFAYWHHRHTVTPESRTSNPDTATPGTLLHDEVEYELPFGKVGELAQRLIVTHQLRSTFTYRHQRTRELFSLLYPRS